MYEQRIVRGFRFVSFVCVLQLFLAAGLAQTSAKSENVLITIPKPYDRVIAGIKSLGGKVKYQFDFIDGIAAEIPAGAMEDVRQLVGTEAIQKDEVISHPGPALTSHNAGGGMVQPASVLHGKVTSAGRGSGKVDLPKPATGSSVLNFDGSDIDKVHSLGYTGGGGVTAVIDTGIRPGFTALGDSVVGGIDFVGDGLGFSNSLNDGHGTFVATLISGKATFDLTSNPDLLHAIASYAPQALMNGTSIAYVGSAPDTKIYVVRVFGKDADAGSNVSTIIAAIQHVIEKKRSGLNIQVCNLSLGKSTLQAGADPLDKAVEALLSNGIVPVVSGGDAGTATLTISSPGSSLGAVTVGSANFARNERILRDVEEGAGVGFMWRPTTGTQTAYFSSRGPNADGRPDPDVIASGFANISQGYGGTSELSIASGTSFSAPIVSGVAAILRQAFPAATARQIRNAMIESADDSLLSDGSTELDQGHGVINAKAAYDMLRKGISNRPSHFEKATSYVRANIEKNTFLNVRDGTVAGEFRGLRPGERKDILYDVPPGTKQVVVKLTGFKPSLPPAQQNSLFGDDMLLSIHTAKTSAFNRSGDYAASEFTTGGQFTIDDPEPGIVRISVIGDWTNAGSVSANFSVTSALDKPAPVALAGSIKDSQIITVPIDIPRNVAKAEFILSWDHNWSRYPTNDLDLILQDPAGHRTTDGATFKSPESVTLTNPQSGRWLVIIQGFDLPTRTDDFRLRIFFDNKPVN